jgi:nucleoside-diphosphate-sugar epimerase
MIAALSFVGGFIEVLLYLLGTTSAPGWPSLIAALCFLGGVQLFFLGVIGEYVGLTFDEVKGRPRYLIDRQYSSVLAALRNDPPRVAPTSSASAQLELDNVIPITSELSRSGLAALTADGRGITKLDALVTGRTDSLFASDLETSREALSCNLRGRRVLIVGGGGSIGAATVGLVIDYAPAAVHVVDQNENYLAELVRELRGRPNGLPDVDFRALPLDYGSPTMERLLMAVAPYDVVLNFAALKHVRSEKDVYSVLQMFDTNLVRHIRFKRWLAEHWHGAIYFAVSTDKAADPVSLMGASKRLMEDLIFSIAAEHSRSITSARFANVAFSNGSLLQGFCHRLAKRQPLAVPRATRRYFISHREAAELCLLAAFQVPTRHIAVPRVNEGLQLQLLEDIASRLLTFYGLVAVPYTDEVRARRDIERLAARSQWPVLATPLDTSGERSYEDFVGQGETTSDCGLSAVLAVPHVPSGAFERGLFDQLDRLVNDPHVPVGKLGIVDSIKTVLSNFCHADSDRNLDQRL